MITNWFQVALALMNVGAACQYALKGSYRLAIVMCLYGVACLVFATMEEK